MEDLYEKTVSNYEYKKKEKKSTDNYYLTIIDSNGLTEINLSSLGNNKITFGRDESNDIVFDSKLVSSFHGYFEFKNDELYIVDNNSTNGLFINNNLLKESVLNDGDSIKIDNPDNPLSKGLIILITIGSKNGSWKFISLDNKDKIEIGREQKNDIVLKHIGVSLNHATIVKEKDNYYLIDNKSTNGTSLNGKLIENKCLLKEKDVILITNSKLIYSNNKIIYQTYDKGVKLEAFDIVKTVKTKNGFKDISSHINLSIKPGEFVALVGGSGAGKSTFLNCISGFSKPTSGHVNVNDEDLYDNYSVLKNIIGYVPQQDIVYTNLKLIDMLMYSANLRMPSDTKEEEKLEQINTVLKIVELENHKDTYIRQLSGGQRKRASIAVELLADPNLFFLDEPTSGLDPGTERSIMKTLRKMADSGKTVILVTHNTLNLKLCDKVVFIGNGGKLSFSGKPNEALQFFEVDDFVDIYTLLNNDTPYWNNKFLNSNYYENLVYKKRENHNEKNKKSNHSFTNQLLTLTKRYFKTIINDKIQLALLLLQAPLIAFLLSFVSNDGTFNIYDDTKAILFSISCSCVWLGLLNAIQEVCKERVILKKEYMANLKLSAYLLSKFIVQGILAIVQSLLLITTLFILLNPNSKGIFTSTYIEYLIVCFITILSSASLGILVSSISPNSNIAMSIVPLLLVPQLLFSGMLFELEGFGKFLSKFIICRWSVSGLGITTNLNSMPGKYDSMIPNFVKEAESYFEYTFSNFRQVNGIMLVMVVICFVGSYFVLKKQLEN